MTDEHPQFPACWVCGRTILRGERVAAFFTPDAEPAEVCSLCVDRAEAGGWIPASAGPPAQRAQAGRGEGLRRRLAQSNVARRLRTTRESADANGNEAQEPAVEPPDGGDPAPILDPLEDGLEDPLPPSPARANGQGDVAAVEEPGEARAEPDPGEADEAPGDFELASQRRLRTAVEAFNRSEARRKVAGLIRSLGEPAVSARDMGEGESRVVLTVVWELTWYQWEASLQGEVPEVAEIRRGQEVSELSDSTREWNARAGEDGRLRLGAVAGA